MQSSFLKKLIFLGGIVVLLGVAFIFYKKAPTTVVPEKIENHDPVQTEIGKSVEGRSIYSYSFGSGEKVLAFIGGIHGGYEWNTVVLAYKIMDYLEANPDVVPKNITLVVVPSANPDGVYKIVGKEGRFDNVPAGVNTSPGRFNANNVDLNRNFDCKWQPKSTWQQKTVDAGSRPFSEPESLVIKNFVETQNPKMLVFWHSQGGAVYASECEDGILDETLKIMNAYAKASGYPANSTYDAYQTTGDADAWLAKIGVPAITVELKTHDGLDFEQNLAGVKALLQYYSSN